MKLTQKDQEHVLRHHQLIYSFTQFLCICCLWLHCLYLSELPSVYGWSTGPSLWCYG